jgi:hypothetical protein
MDSFHNRYLPEKPLQSMVTMQTCNRLHKKTLSFAKIILVY